MRLRLEALLTKIKIVTVVAMVPVANDRLSRAPITDVILMNRHQMVDLLNHIFLVAAFGAFVGRTLIEAHSLDRFWTAHAQRR